MGAHRALLLFVPAYENWPDLSYLRDEYAQVAEALADQGYEIEPDSGCDDPTSGVLSRRIESFLAGARRGEHLVVYLSGHGFEHGGKHWFAGADSVPSSAGGVNALKQTNVDLDDGWGDPVNASRAEKVLFVVDACRDRDPRDSAAGGPLYDAPRGTDKLGFLMACEPAEQAAVGGTEGAPGGRYSLFTQALREVLADARGDLRGEALMGRLADAMDDLRARQPHPLPRQRPVLGEGSGGRLFPLLPVREQPHRVREQRIRDHEAWRRVADRAEAEAYRDEVLTVLGNLRTWLEQAPPRVQDDPWLDWEADQRAAGRLSELIRALPREVRFSAAEAALLALAPALYHGFRVKLVSRADRDLADEWSPYPRLQRQTDTTVDARRRKRDRDVVTAWVTHRTHGRPGDFHRHTGECSTFMRRMLRSTDELTELCTSQRMGRLFQVMQHGGEVLTDLLAAPPDGADAEVRLEVVGPLLCAAQIMALDTDELPVVLVEHIGGTDRIGLAHVRRAVDEAEWIIPSAGDASGGIVRLRAACDYPALMAAFQEHVTALDRLLCGDLDRRRLPGLPLRASDVEVRPVQDPGSGRPKFLPVVRRFELDGTKVRELLVGEQLYQERHFALRELYQNAMDACRVRWARQERLAAERGDERTWAGRITVSQGVDGNRMYLECVDNGSGMGRVELLQAFAQGGVRLADLPSFQEERQIWEDLGITFQENSRFGIGVLSYFMLADEVEVTTRKFDSRREEGPLLKVTIAGPDHLFQVTSSEEETTFCDDPCGTRVRWWLREDATDLSCVQVLRSVLGVAEFHTEARYRPANGPGDDDTWLPGEYRSRLNTGPHAVISAGGAVVADDKAEVFWCEEGGALLVDGIAVDGRWFTTDRRTGERRVADRMDVRGAVINLKGRAIKGEGDPRAPRLSVDRRHVVDDVTGTVFALLRRKQAASRLAESEVLTERWLSEITRTAPRLADAVVEGLIARRAQCQLDGAVIDMARTGYFTGDRELRNSWLRGFTSRSGRMSYEASWSPTMPEHILLWRLVAHFADDVRAALGEELCPPDLTTAALRPALPSDGVVLGFEDATGGVSWDREPLPGALLAYAEEVHETYEWVVARLDELGRPPRHRLPVTDVPLPSLRIVLSRDADGAFPFLIPGEQVSARHVLKALDGTELSPAEILDLLEDLGLDVRPCTALRDPGSAEAVTLRRLLSRQLNGAPPWVPVSGRSSDRSEHFVAAAKETGMSVPEIRAVFETQGELPGPDDVSAVSGRWPSPWPEEGSGRRVAGLPFVHRLARLNSTTPRDAALLLQAHGYEVPETPEDDPVPDHAELLTLPLYDGSPLDLNLPATLVDLHVLAVQTDATLYEVRDRLRSLSVQVPDQALPATLGDDDQVLLTQVTTGGGRSRRGLDPRRPVPLAHVAICAARLGTTVVKARALLAELGMTVDPVPDPEPEWFGLQEEVRLSVPWIPYGPGDTGSVVPLAHLICVSADNGWTMEETAERLRVRGLNVPEAPGGAWEAPADEDLCLLSHSYDRRQTWLPPDLPVPTQHVVKKARETGMSVGAVRNRLLQLGCTVFGRDTTYAAAVVAEDTLLLRLGGRDAWVEDILEKGPVPAAHVWTTAYQSNGTVLETADRMRAAGLTLQDAVYPDEHPRERDMLLLQENAAVNGDVLPLDETVGLEHLLVAAHRLRTDVTTVAARLKDLGMDVPDVAAAVRRAWALVPRAPGPAD
ncbi:caspase family protein [Streptomyces sp. NPDC051310]|uniref:wHTH domain-containing protein n=1 Tax=Streptomyces sp. NPDC051310 TaxID=3365649 RepID=UPI0037B751C7